MDTVRFGRVLGQGARQAVKTLISAVDAATAPNPNPTSAPTSSSSAPGPTTPPSLPPRPAPPTVFVLPPAPPQSRPSAATTARGLAEGSRRFGRAVWGPTVRLSGVLWLELSGVFFALFALVAAIATWRLRAALFAVPASEDRTRLLFAAGMVVVFGFFSLSSFLKANRRSRQP